MNTIPAAGRSHMHDLFVTLRAPARWHDLSMRFPYGGQWGHDTVELVRQVVNGIRDTLVQFDAPFGVVCAYTDDSKSKIDGVIVFNEAETHVIPLKLTPKLVRIGERDRRTSVYVARPHGPLLLVNALADEIERICAGAFRVA